MTKPPPVQQNRLSFPWDLLLNYFRGRFDLFLAAPRTAPLIIDWRTEPMPPKETIDPTDRGDCRRTLLKKYGWIQWVLNEADALWDRRGTPDQKRQLNDSLQREMNEVSHVKPNPQSEAECGTLVGNGIVGQLTLLFTENGCRNDMRNARIAIDCLAVQIRSLDGRGSRWQSVCDAQGHP